jgi:hypothetical protein
VAEGARKRIKMLEELEGNTKCKTAIIELQTQVAALQ